MAANVGESTSGSSSSSSVAGDGGGSFECNICFELPQEPIVTLCGHLFCWPCLYKWLHIHLHSPECPVCKAVVEEDKLVRSFRSTAVARTASTPGPRKTMPPAGPPTSRTGQPGRGQPQPRRLTPTTTSPTRAPTTPGSWAVVEEASRWPTRGGETTPSRSLPGDVYLKALLILATSS